MNANDLRENTYTNCGKNGAWPEKDNCYIVEIKNKNGSSYTNHYMPKPEYDMIMLLQSLIDKVPDESINALGRTFEEYGTWKYSEGSSDESLSHADESI